MECPSCSYETSLKAMRCPQCAAVFDRRVLEEYAHLGYIQSKVQAWEERGKLTLPRRGCVAAGGSGERTSGRGAGAAAGGRDGRAAGGRAGKGRRASAPRTSQAGSLCGARPRDAALAHRAGAEPAPLSGRVPGGHGRPGVRRRLRRGYQRRRPGGHARLLHRRLPGGRLALLSLSRACASLATRS